MSFTNEPAEDYDKYDAKRTKLEERYPECALCGCPILDNFFRVEGSDYHISCFEKEYEEDIDDYIQGVRDFWR